MKQMAMIAAAMMSAAAAAMSYPPYDIYTGTTTGTPVLSATEAAKRTYAIYGRTSLYSGEWMPVPSGQESNYNFFKVVV